MKKFAAMWAGLLLTLLVINAWAGTFAPPIERQERLVLDDTFYDKHVQLDTIFADLAERPGQQVLALGDSTLYGAVTYENETIPWYLRERLQRTASTVDVHNLAYPGARPADLYAMLKLAAPTKPALVVVDVNVVFFSEQLLAEGALANKTHRRMYLFEQDVPQGIFTDNRVEEALKVAFKSTNIGQYEQELNQFLFGTSLRKQVRAALEELHPQPPTASPAIEPTQDLIGKGWREKTWGDKQVQTMARIYGQGPLTEQNDSVRMLRRMAQYANEQDIPVLFYLTPQNEALIGQFFSVPQLNENEEFLKRVLAEEGAWTLDLRHTVPEREFGDYDHLLRGGHQQVAEQLAAEIARKGVLQP